MTSGRLGIRKTRDRILNDFWWPGIQNDVTRFCRSCDVRQKTVPKGTVPRVPLQRMPVIDSPFKSVAVDLVGPIYPPSDSGCRYILTLVDYCTRYPEAVPLKKVTAEDVAEALVNMYSRVGVPEELLTDMGPQFTSECMKEVSRLLSIRHLTTSPYHPMCNGLVERFNATLKAMLKRLCSEKPRQWDRYINALLFAYREVPQQSTGFAPFELLYGRTVRGPMKILRSIWTGEEGETEARTSYQYVFELRERLQEIMKVAREELERSHGRYKRYFDRRSKERRFAVADKVLVLLPTDNNKLLMHWRKPFRVTKIIGINDYEVEVRGKGKVYHANLLKRYHSRSDTDGKRCERATEGLLLQVASAAILEADEWDQDDTINGNSLLKLGTCQPKETAGNVKISEELTYGERKEAQEVIGEFRNAFTDLPGSTNLAVHRIRLTSDHPVKSRPYAIPFHIKSELENDIRDMLKMNIIRASESPYASPVVLVRKPDGTNRVCVDYRKLNRLTICDPEPMTPLVDFVQDLARVRYFTKIDLSKGYWQFRVETEDVHKTAFVVHNGTYEFLRMPFGLVNSAATLVRGLRKLLERLEHADHYVDEIVIHTPTWRKHVAALRGVLKSITQAHLTIRPSKCVIGARTLSFIGHKIGHGLIHPSEENILKIRKAKRPGTKKELSAFLGLTGFIENIYPTTRP